MNDLVQTSMVLAQGGSGALVLTSAEKLPGERAYFHARADESVCPNRTGTLAAYRQPSGESLTVYNDGAITYQDAHATVFERQRLGREDLAHLMQAFQGVGFNGLANSMPPVDRTQGQASVTLICARHQRVLLSGNQPAPAALMQSLEQVKAKALAEADYRLTYDEKREITFLSWPFPQLPVSQAGSKIREAAKEEFDARCAVRLVRGDYRLFHQELPHEFFTKLPTSYSKSPDRGPPSRCVRTVRTEDLPRHVVTLRRRQPGLQKLIPTERPERRGGRDAGEPDETPTRPDAARA